MLPLIIIPGAGIVMAYLLPIVPTVCLTIAGIWGLKSYKQLPQKTYRENLAPIIISAIILVILSVVVILSAAANPSSPDELFPQPKVLDENLK